jgi:hypothetical protein
MHILKNRHLTILTLLLKTEQPITSQELADAAMASVRTVKNDIHFLDSELQAENIAKIRSYKARGYQLEPLDQQKFDEEFKHIRVMSSYFRSHSIEHTMRKLYIIQKLLANDYVKLDDLCEQLYIARSTITEDMNQATKYIESYHLKLVSVPGKGIHVDGKEQDIRSAMVEVASSQYHDFDAVMPVPEFTAMFYDERQQYEDIRHAFLKHLRESKISLKDLASKKCATHLCLIRSRVRNHKYPKLSDHILKEVRETYEYGLVQEIFSDTLIHEFIGEVPEIELANFARILLAKRDVNLRIERDIETLNPKLINRNLKIYRDVMKKMKNEFGARLFNMEMYRIFSVNIESLQMILYLQHHYDHTDGHRIITYNENIETLVSPVALEITREMICQVEGAFHERICGPENQAYAVAIDKLLERVSYPYRKMRLAVTSNGGRATAELIGEDLEKSYGSYIQSIEVFELYEMRRVNFSDYDAVIITGDNLYPNYPLPFITYERTVGHNDREYMFEELFKYGYDLTIVDKTAELIELFPKIETGSPDDLIHTLTFKHAKDDQCQKMLWKLYQQKKRILPYYFAESGVEIVFFEHRLVTDSFIEVYSFAQPVYAEENMSVKYLIAISLQEDLEPAYLRLMANVLYLIAMDSTYTESMMENKLDAVRLLFQKIIRDDFISQ